MASDVKRDRRVISKPIIERQSIVYALDDSSVYGRNDISIVQPQTPENRSGLDCAYNEAIIAGDDFCLSHHLPDIADGFFDS